MYPQQIKYPEGPMTYSSLIRHNLMHHPWEAGVLVFLTLLAVILSVVNLGDYPTISGWDEGMYLQFASNLIHHGEYATRNGATFERLVPVGGTGPTLIVPVALALWLGNDNLVAARLAIVAYLLITLIGVYLLARRIGGQLAAIASIPLFLTAGYGAYDTFWMGRQVLAEIPAFAFLMFGVWAWFKSWNGRLPWLIASGVLTALAVVTKNQFIWVLGPSFALLALIDLFYYGQLRWGQRLVPLAGIIIGYAAWFLLSLWIVEAANRASYLETQKLLTAATFLHLSPQRWLTNLKFFYKSEQWLITLIAIAYGLFRSRSRTQEGLQHVTLPLLAGVSLLNFIGLSLPWARYLYPALALAALCGTIFIADLIGWAGARWKLTSASTTGLLVLIILILTGSNLGQMVQRINAAPDVSTQRFAVQVDQLVPAQANILNWEWEIEFYSQHSFIHPPFRLFPALLDQIYNQRHSAILEEPRIPLEANYLVVGPFTSQIHVFDAALMQRNHRLLISEGMYQLYQLD